MDKYICYVDGSFREGKAAWGFIAYKNVDNPSIIKGFGCTITVDSGQAEIISVLKALYNLQALCNDIPLIEIRSDYLPIVRFLRDSSKPTFNPKYKNEICQMYDLVKSYPCKIKGKKVNNKDQWLKKVHNIACTSLNNYPVDNDIYYLNDIPTLDNHRVADPDLEVSNVPSGEHWFNNPPGEVVLIPVSSIVLTESKHLNARNIALKGQLKKIQQHGYNALPPIAVAKYKEDNYTLVVGLSRLCAAKLMGLSHISAVICDINHQEFLYRYDIKE